jgi:hypothetical protein
VLNRSTGETVKTIAAEGFEQEAAHNLAKGAMLIRPEVVTKVPETKCEATPTT